MAKTLIIDPGHGGTDPGANGFGIKEKDWTLKISLYQYNRLKELGANVAITRTTDKSLSRDPRTNLIKGKYDYCMSNHFNAFNGSARGVETIYSIYSKNTIAKRLADVIVSTSKLPLRRVFNREGKAGDYYFMHRLTGSTQTVIVEYGFIDNKSDHDYYKNESNFYKVAEAVVKEWCSILGVKYTAPAKIDSKPKPSTNKSKSGNLYKVQIGAFKNKANADQLALRARARGFDQFIVNENGLFKVQIGAYSKKSNADAQAEKAKEADFDVYIEGGTDAVSKSAAKPKTFSVGQKVKVKSSAKNYTRTPKTVAIPSRIKGKSYTIEQVGSSDVLLKEIVSWVKKTDLQ